MQIWLVVKNSKKVVHLYILSVRILTMLTARLKLFMENWVSKFGFVKVKSLVSAN